MFRKTSPILVREMRLELTRHLPHAPQTCLSTYSSTLALLDYYKGFPPVCQLIKSENAVNFYLFIMSIYALLLRAAQRRSCVSSARGAQRSDAEMHRIASDCTRNASDCIRLTSVCNGLQKWKGKNRMIMRFLGVALFTQYSIGKIRIVQSSIV